MANAELRSSPGPLAAPPGAGLAAMAPWVQAALGALGVLVALQEVVHLDPRAPAGPVLAALAQLGGFLLAGWIARRLLVALGVLLDLLATAAERVAAVPLAAPPSPVAERPAAESRTMTVAEFRVALHQGQWAEAETLLETFTERHPGDSLAQALREELGKARGAAIAQHQARIDAAREANDPARVLEIREALAGLLEPQALGELNRTLARWFMALIQKRLRRGAISVDVAVLASRVATTFDTTPEGASLKAALPTLRRSVGLCARCGQPYTGIADACPACLAAGALSTGFASASWEGNGDASDPADEELPDSGADELE
jgi:hypothetical protein